VQWCCGASACLFFGKFVLSGEAGVQQGDPLLFSLAIRPLLEQLASLGCNSATVCAFYLDDGILCGSVRAVSEALALLQARRTELGWHFNLSKHVLVVLTSDVSNRIRRSLPQMFSEIQALANLEFAPRAASSS
jgi:hypothetical protein